MSKLEIGEVIKKLRRDRAMTQEQLADIMGVSIPAVSKWESGTTYPDITILPNLARLFEVSIDKLMNFNADLNEADIEKLNERLEKIIRENKIEEYIKITQEYANKYISDYKLKYNLSNLNTLAFVSIRDKEAQDILIENSISYLNDIIDNTTDIELKENSLAQLSSNYVMKNEPDKAEETIKKIYKPACNPDTMLPLIYMQQGKIQESKELMQKTLYKSLMEATASANSLGAIYSSYEENIEEKHIDFDKAKKYYEVVLSIREILEDDKTMYSNYLNLANLARLKKDDKECIKYLKEMLSCVRKVNLNDYTQINTKWCFNEMKDENLSMKIDVYPMLIKSIEETFNNLKDNEEYVEIIREIKELWEKNKLN